MPEEPLVETPALVLDLDIVERNIGAMQEHANAHGVALRPHIKTHKLPQLAHLQLAAGAVGITCEKLGEAEVFARAGCDDILITFPIVGQHKLERLAALARGRRVVGVCDSAVVAAGLVAHGIDALVECDTGMGRTGVQSPEQALAVARSLGDRFAGLMTYPTAEGGGWLPAARALIESAGLAVPIVSGGGSHASAGDLSSQPITETRPGVYVFNDRMCLASGSELASCAARVHATVVSRPTPTRAILDAGSKALAADLPPGIDGHGLIVEHPDAVIVRLTEEHGMVELPEGYRGLTIGEVVQVVPNHICPVVNLYDAVTVSRGGVPLERWAVAARGRSS